MGEMDKYIETFRQEADELLASVELAVLAIEDDPADHDAINSLFRAMHTIKGSGAMFGFDDVAAFTHHIESLLDKVRNGTVPVTREFIDIVLAARDYITSLLLATDGSSTSDAAIGEALVARARALIDGDSSQDAPQESAHQSAPTSETSAPQDEIVFRIRFRPQANFFATGSDPALLIDELQTLGACQIVVQTESLPTFEDMDPETCYLGWDIIMTSRQGIDAIKDVFIFVDSDSLVDIQEISRASQVDADTPLPKLGEILLERKDVTPKSIESALTEQRVTNKPVGSLLVDAGEVTKDKVASALTEQRVLEKQKCSATQDTIRVAASKLDQLINIVGELVINQEQLNQSALECNAQAFVAPVEVMSRLVGELRDLVMNIRMVPIGTTFTRFKRLIRDTSIELGKEVELITVGGDTEMDKTVIDRLGDPLVHLIRNSIDHGIEMPEVREAAGKPRQGTIRLIAEHQGTNVVITVKDDGGGLDAERIRAKAIAQGLISADEVLCEEDVFRLILAPGFSTASQVTNLSGRGVGMDVVKREIEALHGSVHIQSVKGQGTSINLTLPLTLAIIDGLLVDVNGNRYVIPVSMIEECLELSQANMAVSEFRNIIQLRGEPVPIIRLRELFLVSTPRPEVEETVVVRLGEQRLGVVVDHVIGDYQTVIKPLSRLYKNAEGISGATIMGDGNVALILDLADLMRIAMRTEEASYAQLSSSGRR